MAYTTIDKPSDYFNTVIYTGDMVDGDGTGHTQSITGVGFQPDWVWHKGRAQGRTNILVDSVRGLSGYNWLISNSTSPVITANTNGAIKSIDSNGITLENGDDSSSKSNNAGKNGETYVFWNWRTGTSFTNDASSTSVGSIDSAGSVSTTAGFSIISWTNAGNGAETVAHGLGVTPKMIIIKSLNETAGWLTYHEAIGNTHALFLNTTVAKDDNAELFNDTSPTATVFSTGVTGLLTGGSNLIAYCFAEKQGYSKFGSYTGNGNADGPFVYTGFKPAFVLLKLSSVAGENWYIFDNKRSPFNVMTQILYANLGNAEATGTTNIDFLSNGFKLRNSGDFLNGSGQVHIYMAFAENPFVTSGGVPATAK